MLQSVIEASLVEVGDDIIETDPEIVPIRPRSISDVNE